MRWPCWASGPGCPRPWTNCGNHWHEPPSMSTSMLDTPAAVPSSNPWRSPEGRWSALALMVGSAVALLLALVIGATQGAYAVALKDLWPDAGHTSAEAEVFWHIRAPRLVMAV